MDIKINGQKYEYIALKCGNYKGTMVAVTLQMENESSYSRQA